MCYDLLMTKFSIFVADQEERQWAIREYRENKKDVLVATDVASKGLDFPNIKHIINYDMPNDIENYGTHKHTYTKYIYIHTHIDTCNHMHSMGCVLHCVFGGAVASLSLTSAHVWGSCSFSFSHICTCLGEL